jgi:transforming growth factor-beta-induced protein
MFKRVHGLLMMLALALAASTGAWAQTQGGAGKGIDLATMLQSNGDFSTFVNALNSTGLMATLKSGQYTVFAPTNAAFARMSKEDQSSLTSNPNALKAMIAYHIVPGNFGADSLLGHGNALPTLNSRILKTHGSDTEIRADEALVIKSNIIASNGTIYAIDGVLLP